MSDSHGREEYVYSVLYDNRDADMIIHLGDGGQDLDYALREVNFQVTTKIVKVKGNCDFCSDLPITSFENIEGFKFYITHGYVQNVKMGVDHIYMDAKKSERNVVLFGHTHRPFYENRDGIYLFNPGAVKNGYYGVIKIEGENISFEKCSF